MKNFFHKLFFPNKIIGFLVFNIGFFLLIYVFTNHLESTVISYVSYLLSFYALLIFSTWFYKVCKSGSKTIKKSEIYNLYRKNTHHITKLQVILSLIGNFMYGIFKLCFGLYYKSWWFITFAIYYLLLCLMKLLLIKNYDEEQKSYAKLKTTGIILLFMNLILIGIIILIIETDRVISYHGYLIYLVALYDFYLIINAIVNIVKYRHSHSPILTASKCINLTVAMISMISLEVAMVTQFGNNDSSFKLIMTSSMGLGIALINSAMAVFMIISADKKLNNVKKNRYLLK